jgi:hypothetical protein
MTDILRFKEFVDFNNPIDPQTREEIITISQSHPVLENHPTIKTMMSNKSARISWRKVAQINLKILERSTALARKAGQAKENERFLILAEMNLLNTASSALSSIISSRMQISVDRLSKIAKIMG